MVALVDEGRMRGLPKKYPVWYYLCLNKTMTWTKPIRYEPQVLTIPPGKIGLIAKEYCDEFIIVFVTSDEGMIMEGYAAGTPLSIEY